MKQKRLYFLLIVLFFSSCTNYMKISYSDINRFENGKKEGTWILSNDTTGSITISNYSNGELHGTFIDYHNNGIVAVRGQYHYGEKNGEWSYYMGDGGRVAYQKFRKGKLIKAKYNNISF